MKTKKEEKKKRRKKKKKKRSEENKIMSGTELGTSDAPGQSFTTRPRAKRTFKSY